MLTTQNVMTKIIGACLVVFFLLPVWQASAQKTSVVTTLFLRGEYNDNVFYDEDQEQEDGLVVVSPEISLIHETETGHIKSSAELDVERYFDNTELDTENQKYKISGANRIGERIEVNALASYLKDTTYDSELLETGILFDREDRERIDLGLGMSYEISEKLGVDLSYKFKDTEYDSTDRVDYDTHVASVRFKLLSDSQRDIYSFRTQYSQTDSDSSETLNYRFTVGWTHQFSETMKMRASLGARYTDSESKTTDRDEQNWGGVLNLFFRKKTDWATIDFGYNRRMGYSSFGEPIEVDKLYYKLYRQLKERFGVGIEGNIVLSRSDTDLDDTDSKFVTISPYLNYRLTEFHKLSIAYQYAWDSDDTQANDREISQNRVWIGVTFVFPKEW